MKPDKPPEGLKAERVQKQSLEVVQPFVARVVAILEGIETWARRLISLFAPGDSDKQS